MSVFDPWLEIYYMVTGKNSSGVLINDKQQLMRMEAIRLYTAENGWFFHEEGKLGSIEPGKLADLAVLTADYFSIPEEEIKGLESVLTIVGGKVVYASAEFSKLAPPAAPVSPDWSPVKRYGGYQQTTTTPIEVPERVAFSAIDQQAPRGAHRWVFGEKGIWELGCDCFAF